MQTPVLIDGDINGQPRKLLAQASRNGYFFVLDRTNGKTIVSKPYVTDLNWSKGVDAKGQPIRDPAKEPQTDGTLVIPASGGITNWPPPSFDPANGSVLRQHVRFVQHVLSSRTPTRSRKAMAAAIAGVWSKAGLAAIDYKTGKIRWRHEYPGVGGGVYGVLSTAGGWCSRAIRWTISSRSMPATGDPLWHAKLPGSVANGAESFELGGQQYVVVGAGDSLYAFTMAK